MSSTGPRTLRTCMFPSAGLIVRRMYPVKPRSGRNVPFSDLHILIEQLGDGGAGLGLASGGYLLKQRAKLDLRGQLGLAVRRNRISRPVSGPFRRTPWHARTRSVAALRDRTG